MFKDIKLISSQRKENDSNFNIIYSFLVQDSDFEQIVSFESNCGSDFRSQIDAVAILYDQKNLSVPRNVAQLYLNLFKNKLYLDVKWLSIDREWLDRNYPHIKYGQKYYQCVINQIKKLQYINSVEIIKSCSNQ